MTSIPAISSTSNVDSELLGADAQTGDLIERYTNVETGRSYLVRLRVLDELSENFSPLRRVVNDEPFEFNGYDSPLDVPSYYGCDVD